MLDLFAGSASLAHAVMDLNRLDGGQRRTISIQLPEPVVENSEAHLLGYKNIAEVARARIEKAAEKYVDQLDLLGTAMGGTDFGFRSFQLVDTNFIKWQVTSDVVATALEQHILDLLDSGAGLASSDGLLIEILLKQGYSLTVEIGNSVVDGLNLKTVGSNLVIAYLEAHTKPTLGQLRQVLEHNPARFIILEDAFQGDDELKTNLVQECKSRGVELWTA